METNSSDREAAAQLLELADDARAATVRAAALPWWIFALMAGCAGLVCGAMVANHWVIMITGLVMMTVVGVLCHRLGASRGQHLTSPWLHSLPFLPRSLSGGVMVGWIGIGYGMIASVVYFAVLLYDERWRNRRLAEGRFEEHQIW